MKSLFLQLARSLTLTTTGPRRWRLLLFGAILAFPPISFAQFSGWLSEMYGYSSNPLHTYQESSDRLSQTFVQLGYGDPGQSRQVCVAYTGGLTLFENASERNYYEHAVSLTRLLRFGTPPRQLAPPDSDGENQSDDEDSEVPTDTLRPYLSLALKLSARHDRAAFSAYDNQALNLSANYRGVVAGPLRFRIVNSVEYRNYSFLHILSNLTDAFSLRLEHDAGGAFAFGAYVGGAVKYYPIATYDTSQYESQQTFAGKSNGKGKGGGKGVAPGQLKKHLLVNVENHSAAQANLGLLALERWLSGSFGAEFTYRAAPGPAPRYLAQYANSSTLQQDIYSDYMSYHGPELSLTLKQQLPLGLRSTIAASGRNSVYSAPSLDLAGNETSSNRQDLRGELEISVSKYLETASGLGLEIGVTATALRNQSNDDYNDYSVFGVAIDVGIGF